jgi:uncharacterized protein (TIGR02118 family)
MSVSYFVRYEGHAQDFEQFLAYYRERHAPILASMPGMRRIVLHRPIAWHDPFPVKPDRFLLIAQMIFDSAADLDRALQSQPRAAAREDFANFPHLEASVYHQAAFSEEVFSSPA